MTRLNLVLVLLLSTFGTAFKVRMLGEVDSDSVTVYENGKLSDQFQTEDNQQEKMYEVYLTKQQFEAD